MMKACAVMSARADAHLTFKPGEMDYGLQIL